MGRILQLFPGKEQLPGLSAAARVEESSSFRRGPGRSKAYRKRAGEDARGAKLLGTRSYVRGSWHGYERSDRTLRSGAAVLLGTRSN